MILQRSSPAYKAKEGLEKIGKKNQAIQFPSNKK